MATTTGAALKGALVAAVSLLLLQYSMGQEPMPAPAQAPAPTLAPVPAPSAPPNCSTCLQNCNTHCQGIATSDYQNVYAACFQGCSKGRCNGTYGVTSCEWLRLPLPRRMLQVVQYLCLASILLVHVGCWKGHAPLHPVPATSSSSTCYVVTPAGASRKLRGLMRMVQGVEGESWLSQRGGFVGDGKNSGGED
ncbi:hypothetical protein HU200_058316 [Digitaria exilis]|uniref:Uncharacterized protein n=1 Tax=Digitaria exilis TaxID=1010633 RepID=A0A835E0L1_9POAL|nr:hypothetical protein HU200_058316 [Digitaria exilis]